jgi:glyoxylate reductase
MPRRSDVACVMVTRRIPEPGLDTLAEAGVRVTICQPDGELEVRREDLLTGVRACDVLIPLLTERIDRVVLEAGERLRGVANMAVGFDNIDVAAATELGIPVSNTPGVLTETTADLAWALILSTTRQIPRAHAYMVSGRYRIWGPNLFLGVDVGRGGNGRRKVLGIVGFGRIGRAVARRATGFDMEVLAHDPFARDEIDASTLAVWAELDDLLERSDVVTLHTTLTEQTRHLVGERELRLMKPDAVLINVARGPVVDEAALVRALRERWIGGAGLDVYEDEPRMAAGLTELDNVVLLPHIGSASRDTRGRMASMAAENALAHLRGEPAPNAVNPEVYGTEAYRSRWRRLGS